MTFTKVDSLADVGIIHQWLCSVFGDTQGFSRLWSFSIKSTPIFCILRCANINTYREDKQEQKKKFLIHLRLLIFSSSFIRSAESLVNF